MGLFDFFKNDNEKKPAAQPAKPAARPAQPAAQVAPPIAQPAPKPAAPVSEQYTVKSGDSLSKIAKAHYGDALKWHQIYDANKALIGDNPDMIQPSQVLKLPK